jgi:hypothetical protein
MNQSRASAALFYVMRTSWPGGSTDLGKNQKIREPKKRKRGFLSGSFSRADQFYPYPPGIPLLCPGERISEHLLKRIQSLREEGFELEGLEDHQLERIFVVK